MILFKAVDKFYISGRGDVYTGQLSDEENLALKVGDTIQIDFKNNVMTGTIKGIERRALPMHPPLLSKDVGILFKEHVANKKETKTHI